jgi:3-oxoisoapionate decarboxylase
MKRRDFLIMTTGAFSALAVRTGGTLAAAPHTAMGVVQYSFSKSPHTSSALQFLDYCHSLGAGGIQIGIGEIVSDGPEEVRRKAEDLGMYVEAITGLPKIESPDEFERAVAAAKLAGALCLRTACLSGRRYENFSTLDDWKQFVADSHSRLDAALPILERHKVVAGIENHKDWTADELAALIRRYDSEYLGVCVDTGNNISLLDNPMDVVEKLAPYAVTTHIKDMAVEEYAEGFMLSEVPLGQGILDLRRITSTLSKARPHARYSLEMITRDPLKVPCMTEKYWVTFPERNGSFLARTLQLVREHKPRQPLREISSLRPEVRSKVEEENVRECLRYAREQLTLVAA